MNNILKSLPPILTGNELISELSVLPNYDSDIIKKSSSERLISLMNIYDLYIPSQMSLEIYSKLYLAMVRSISKKSTNAAIIQHYENYNKMYNSLSNGIIGGSDSFTIIGNSGIGKSSAINRAVSIITKNQIIETNNPSYRKIIPCLTIQCPFDSSVKGLLLEILRKIDEILGTNHYISALKSRNTTTDMLIGAVSNLALNHIGLLIVDEIQNVVNSKNGKNLVGSLTQLINNSGISICMVGTPESTKFFEQAMFLARRSTGLNYTSVPYDDYFISFCNILLKYQYVTKPIESNDTIIKWLYDHSKGVIAIVIALIHDAQELAILNGYERIDISILNEVYKTRLNTLHSYIDTPILNKTTSIKKNHKKALTLTKINEENLFENLVIKAKHDDLDIVSLLKENCIVEEVCI